MQMHMKKRLKLKIDEENFCDIDLQDSRHYFPIKSHPKMAQNRIDRFFKMVNSTHSNLRSAIFSRLYSEIFLIGGHAQPWKRRGDLGVGCFPLKRNMLLTANKALIKITAGDYLMQQKVVL